MHFTTILSASALLMSGASALAIRNKYVADYRVFGATGCYNNNLGVGTIIDDDFTNNECKSAFNGAAVRSIRLTNIIDGCTIRVFPDATCGYGGQELSKGVCADALDQWKAWSIDCTYKV